MRKWLLLLLGLILIGVLAYFCFMNKAPSIKNDLITKTESIYSQKGLEGIEVGIRGEDLEMTRIVTLKGTVTTEQARTQAGTLAGALEGVAGVDNQLVVKAIPSPYTINAIKAKDGKVTLSGYVANGEVHQKLVSEANTIFGETNVIDKLEEAEGSPSAWYESSKLGLDKLDVVDYGQFKISDTAFDFEGYVGEIDKKERLVKNLQQELNSNYSGTYTIDAPEPTPIPTPEPTPIPTPEPTPIPTPEPTPEPKVVAISCQNQFRVLLSENKINFEYDKAEIKTDSYTLLEKLIEVSKGCPDAKIMIEGHTDSDGSKGYNQRLSEKRAKAVKTYLIGKGVAKSRLDSIGYGETKPVADNSTDAGKERNRRIEFNIKGVE
jgi:OOP family OmpA-OmpF porin